MKESEISGTCIIRRSTKYHNVSFISELFLIYGRILWRLYPCNQEPLSCLGRFSEYLKAYRHGTYLLYGIKI